MALISDHKNSQLTLGSPQAETRVVDAARLLPSLENSSLRLRRRLCELGLLRLNGQVVKATTKVAAGQVLSLETTELLAENSSKAVASSEARLGFLAEAAFKPVLRTSSDFVSEISSKPAFEISPEFAPEVLLKKSPLFRFPALKKFQQGQVRLVTAQAGLAAIFKPMGLHSAALAGSFAPSLEALAAKLLPMGDEPPRMLNRLDFYTSGLVMFSYTSAGRQLWHKSQEGGLIAKEYLAVVEGHLELGQVQIIKQRLDMSKRKKTRICRQWDVDKTRWTRLEPQLNYQLNGCERDFQGIAHSGSNLPLSLVHCTIFKGARHQIRAHLASIEHPLWGDKLYGSFQAEPFFLQNIKVSLPNFVARLDSVGLINQAFS